MDLTKGQKGRRVCGVIEVTIGFLILIGAIFNVTTAGYVNITSFVVAGFMVVTGYIGHAGRTRNTVIAYMVTGIICALYFGYATVSSVILVITYNSQLTEFVSDDDPNLTPYLIVAVVVVALGFIVSVMGVVFAALPWCGRSEEQYEAFTS